MSETEDVMNEIEKEMSFITDETDSHKKQIEREEMAKRIKANTDNLLTLNRQLNKGAKELWCITPEGFWVNLDNLRTPFSFTYHTLLRSIQFKTDDRIHK